MTFNTISDLLLLISNYVLFFNAGLFMFYLSGKGMFEKIYQIGRDFLSLVFMILIVVGVFRTMLENPLIALAESYEWAVWPVRLFWYFGFAASDLLCCWLIITICSNNNLTLSRLTKSITFALLAKSFVNLFGFIDRFALSDLFSSYYSLAIPTLNISITITLVLKVCFSAHKRNITDEVNLKRKSNLLEEGACLYLQTSKENDLFKASQNQKKIKDIFTVALKGSEVKASEKNDERKMYLVVNNKI